MAPRISLLLATVLCGLAAGFFFAFQVAVTRGLARVNDVAYVQAMQAINAAVQNVPFFLVFFGTAPAALAALVLNWRTAPWLVGAGLVLWLVAFGITVVVNVPLNEQLARVTDADPAARAGYEVRWNAANLARAFASTAAFACLAAALLVDRL